jgi:hypothetical protein
MTVTVRAFLIGAAAAGAVAYVLGAAIVVAGATVETTFRLSVGPLLFVAVERDGADVVTTLGPGLGAIALIGGLLNAVASLLLAGHGREDARMER